MTDFQGTEAPGRLPYLQPIPQAHAVLDAARAAISVGAVDRRAPVGIWGYSQGGGAAAAAAEQAKSYAPELNIRGSVVGAPPTNPARTMMFNEGKLSAGVIGYFVNGVRAEYPQLAPKIDAKLNSQGRDFLRKTAGECLVGSVVGHYFRSTKGMTVSGRPLIEELASDPEINSVFQSFVMGRTAPSHPVLLMQNVNDDVVPAGDANATADAWKRGGTNVARANINTPSLPPIGAPGHAVGLVTGNIAVNWLAGRLTQ